MSSLVIWAYLSPDTYLPLTSVVAAIIGVALMMGKSILLVARRLLGAAWGRRRGASSIARPKFGAAARSRSRSRVEKS